MEHRHLQECSILSKLPFSSDEIKNKEEEENLQKSYELLLPLRLLLLKEKVSLKCSRNMLFVELRTFGFQTFQPRNFDVIRM